MNMKTRIAKFLITLTSFTMMTSVNAYQGSADCCNPCANLDPCCPSPARSFYGKVDYIYWGVQEDGLRFAQSGFGPGCCEERTSSCCGDSCGNNSGCSKNHDLNWNSGFKVGAGMANPCCDWEVFVQYTWYRANPKKCAKIGACDLILDDSINVDPTLFGLVDHVNSCWNFRFNNIDALVTNEFCVNNCFSFRPSFGLKAAWIRQKQNIGVVFGDTILVVGSPTGAARCQKQDYWGIGPKFGVTANASLFDSFSLYGNLGLSTLWSSYRLNRNDAIYNSTVTPGDTTVGLVCAKDCRHHVQPVLETSIGVRWDTELCCGDYGFYVDLAWEQQVWFNHNHLIHSVVNHSHGDLTLQGVTVGAGFSF